MPVQFPLANERKYFDTFYPSLISSESITIPLVPDSNGFYYEQLKELPDDASNGGTKPVIAGMREVTVSPLINEFRVDYTNGRIFFNSANKGEVKSVTYYGLGSIVRVEEINYLYTVYSNLDNIYLNKANTNVYVPTADYHPATKKYVDDNGGGAPDDDFNTLTEESASDDADMVLIYDDSVSDYRKQSRSNFLKITIDNSGNVTIPGNLTVQGTTTTIESTTLTVEDPLILLGSGNATDAIDLGLILERNSSNIGIIWDESDDEIALITTNDDGTTSGNVSILTYADLHVNNLTVDGVLSGSVTIGGFTSGSVIFADGSGNLDENNSQLYWDDVNEYLGIGIAPSYHLHVNASTSTDTYSALFQQTHTTNYIGVNNTNAFNTANKAGILFGANTSASLRSLFGIVANFDNVSDTFQNTRVAINSADNGTYAEQMRIFRNQFIAGIQLTASLSRPDLAFGDGDTGFLELVDDELSVTIAGTEASRWDTTGKLIIGNDYVTTPTWDAQVQGTLTSGFGIRTTGAYDCILELQNTNVNWRLLVDTSNSDKLVIRDESNATDVIEIDVLGEINLNTPVNIAFDAGNTSVDGLSIDINATGLSTNSALYLGLDVDIDFTGITVPLNGTLQGALIDVNISSTQNMTGFKGLEINTRNYALSSTYVTGVATGYFSNSTAVTDYKAFEVYAISALGGITNAYGLYIGSFALGVTNAYGVYQVGSGSDNYFEGTITASNGGALPAILSATRLIVGGGGTNTNMSIISGGTNSSRIYFGDNFNETVGIIQYNNNNDSMSIGHTSAPEITIDSTGITTFTQDNIEIWNQSDAIADNTKANEIKFFAGSGKNNIGRIESFVEGTSENKGGIKLITYNTGEVESVIINRDGDTAFAKDITVTGQIIASAGTAAAPSIRLDTDSGFFNDGSNRIQVSLSGTERFYWTGNLYRASSSGPGMRNTTVTATVPGLLPHHSDTTSGVGGTSGTVSLITGGTEGMRVNASQQVGINVAPSVRFHVNAGASVATVAQFQGNYASNLVFTQFYNYGTANVATGNAFNFYANTSGSGAATRQTAQVQSTFSTIDNNTRVGKIAIFAPDNAVFEEQFSVDGKMTNIRRLTTTESVRHATVSKTANYTATDDDHIILCDTSSGSFTITLPAASGNSNLTYYIKKTANANSLTVDANGSETIDGSLTQILTTLDSLYIVCDGSNWHIL